MDSNRDRLRDLPLRSYRPRSVLRTSVHPVSRARFPVVDAHAHLGRWLTSGWSASDVDELLDLMDACGVAAIVNLDGRLPEELESNLERYDQAHPGRFVTFCQLDWRVTSESGFGAALATQLRDAVARGARGLKVWKDLGLHVRDGDGSLIEVDDERLDPVWAAAAEEGIPVLIHIGDPAAFFEPMDVMNERLEELIEHPDWWFGDADRFPRFDALLAAFERMVSRHIGTTFIGAHVANAAEDLAWVTRMLDTYPNLHADMAARVAELGRQPRAAREMIVSHPNRILFGTDDVPLTREAYAIRFRFLETADEHFGYAVEDPPPQGRWAVDGLALPDDVLAAVYGGNARRLIPGLAP